MVTSCHNCVDGLSDLIRHYKLPMKVTQLVNLVANALVIEEKVAVPVEAPLEAPPKPEVLEEVPVPTEPIPVPVGIAATGEDLPLAGWRILVADDEPDQQDFISAVLEDNGARHVSSGLLLGATVDGETDGQESADAGRSGVDGDDGNAFAQAA